MIYPEFIKKGDYIGITACSCGILDKVNRYDISLNHFIEKGYLIKETANVRTNGIVSSDSYTRWEEFKQLLLDKDVKMINIAAGGDFLYEIFDYLDLDLIKNNMKWICGSSDPTSLLFTITTNLDIATIYTPCNMSGFDMEVLDSSLENYFKVINGEKIIQTKYLKYEKKEDKTIDGYNLTVDNHWDIINGDVNTSGILIGGCLECIKDVIGTKFDKVNEFIEKYKEDGIVWYFDVFAMGAEGLSNTLRQMKYAGWFKYTKAILIGKVKYQPDYQSIDYSEAIKRVIDDIPVINYFDIGHVKPSFTFINGAKVKVTNDSIEFL